MKYLLIIGAKSDMAQALARKFAENGYNLYLSGRGDLEELNKLASDLKIRYNIDTKVLTLDLEDIPKHKDIYEKLPEKPIGAICAAGYLGKQEKAQSDYKEMMKIITSNYSGCMSVLNVIANDFETNKSGFIIGISSVAGERGRKSNYIYGSAKAGFTAYLSGLRNRLNASGVQVLTVKPGFVDTKMTEGLELPPLLTAKPNDVADKVFKAWQKKKDVVYIKSIWRWVMWVIRIIPERIFKRLNL